MIHTPRNSSHTSEESARMGRDSQILEGQGEHTWQSYPPTGTWENFWGLGLVLCTLSHPLPTWVLRALEGEGRRKNQDRETLKGLEEDPGTLLTSLPRESPEVLDHVLCTSWPETHLRSLLGWTELGPHTYAHWVF